MALTVEEVEAVLRLKDQLSDKLNTAQGNLSSFGSAAMKVGAGLTASVTLPILAIGGSAIKMAMDAVESENLFEVSFKGMAQQARDWSVETSEALGLNQFELRRTSSTLFTMFDSMGIATEGAFEMATGLTTLSADMASFFNLRPDEAFEKLRAGIVGEAEPLKRLGILVDENTVKTAAYRHGIAKQGAELSQQQKVLARYAAILDQTKNAQGDLARTLTSPTNQLRLMGEQVKQAAVSLGMALLPTVQVAIGAISQLIPILKAGVQIFSNLPEPVKVGVIAVAALAAALGPLLIVAGSIASAIVTLSGALATFSAIQTTTAVTTTALSTALRFAGIGAGLFGAAVAGWAIGKWIADLHLFGQASMSVGESFEFGATKLFNWVRGMEVADADIETAILSRRTLGETTTKVASAEHDVAQALKSATESAQRDAEALAKTEEATKAATEAAKEHKKMLIEAAKFESELTGIRHVQANQFEHTIASMMEREEAWQELRKKSIELEGELRSASRIVPSGFGDESVRAWNATLTIQQEAAKAHWRTLSDIANELGLKQMERDLAKMRGLFGNVFAGIKGSFTDLWKGMSGGKGIGGLFQNIGGGFAKGIGDMLSGGLQSLISGGLSLAMKGLGKLFGGMFGAAGKEANKLRDTFLQQAGGLDELRKKAQLAGVSLDALMNAKKPKDVEKAIKAINEQLEEFKKKEEEAAKALAKMHENADKFRSTFSSALRSIGESGRLVSRGMADVIQQVKATGKMSQEITAFVIGQAKRVVAGLQTFMENAAFSTKESALAAASAISATFFSLIDQGLSATEIMEQMAPVINELKRRLRDMGIDGGKAFETVDRLAQYMSDTVVIKAIKAIGGLNEMLIGLHNTGLLDQQTFAGLTNQITATFNELIAKGYHGDTALRLMQPTLQTIWELMTDFGLAVDPATKKLIDMGLQAGIVGDKFRDPMDRMATALDTLVALMGDFIEELRLAREAAEGVDDALAAIPDEKHIQIIVEGPEGPFDMPPDVFRGYDESETAIRNRFLSNNPGDYDRWEDIKGEYGFEKGGRVRRTGMALIHAGETIVPAAASASIGSGTYADMLYELRNISRQLRTMPAAVTSAAVLAQR